MALVLAILSSIFGILGGLLALKSQRKIGWVLGFTAGALLGLVAFGILPEIVEIVHDYNIDVIWPMVALVAGFLTFHAIEKSILLHHSDENEYPAHTHPQVGIASAAALIGHSFLDGLSIGLAYKLDEALGLAVAIAVIGHRFADGFNIVNVLLLHKNSRERTVKIMTLGAMAPVLGALTAIFIAPSQNFIVMYLGFFAGFLLYIGASDILPQAHSRGSSYRTIAFTVAGALFMFGITRLA